MLAPREKRCSSADSSNPLLDLGILQNVLSYIGPGHRLFIAPVSKCWNDTYIAVKSQQLTVCDESGFPYIETCDPQMTLYSSVLASPARVQLAHEAGLDCNTRAYQRSAGKHADTATLAAAHDLGMEYTSSTMAGAAQRNKLAEVQYLHNQDCPWPSWLFEEAARSGRLELLRWCHEHGCPGDVELVTHHAAAKGDIDMMAWILQQPGASLHKIYMQQAVYKGHIGMCQFLHSQQCQWHERCTGDAAAGGYLELLRWLVNNGCPWSAQELCMEAARGGSVAVLEYLREQELLTSVAMLTDMLSKAGAFEGLAAAQWLKEQGAEWPTEFVHGQWYGAVLAWARAEGCTTPVVSDSDSSSDSDSEAEAEAW
jgi:hypothetical protein